MKCIILREHDPHPPKSLSLSPFTVIIIVVILTSTVIDDGCGYT